MYTKPELTIEQFEVEDIITTSTDTPDTTLDYYEAEKQSMASLI